MPAATAPRVFLLKPVVRADGRNVYSKRPVQRDPGSLNKSPPWKRSPPFSRAPLRSLALLPEAATCSPHKAGFLVPKVAWLSASIPRPFPPPALG